MADNEKIERLIQIWTKAGYEKKEKEGTIYFVRPATDLPDRGRKPKSATCMISSRASNPIKGVGRRWLSFFQSLFVAKRSDFTGPHSA